MKLGEKVVRLRKVNGISQEELASRLNVSRQAVSRWEMGTAKPDADNIVMLGKVFGVSTDYLLNDEYELTENTGSSDEKHRSGDKKILHTNLTRIAIITQAAILNTAMRPFDSDGVDKPEFVLKFVPLILCSVWMAYNLRYEKDTEQYRKNTRTELLYCVLQAGVMLYGYYSTRYLIATTIIFVNVMVYIFCINPKYMNRKLTR